jgi:beta-lactamase class D
MHPVINRRHAIGLLAAASLLPSRSHANVAYQRSEIRADLAKRFVDEGTAGTFVGYKTDDYLIIASDKDRSGEAKLPASTFKIPNSIIALETGVVEDPDKIFWDGVTRSISVEKDHTCAARSPPPCARLSGDRPAHRAGGCRNISTSSSMATATSAAASTSSG